MNQMMGDLPQSRVTPCVTFLHTGLDYAGPIMVRLGKGRGYQAQKAYIALFVCMVTRALHLELVSDYTSNGFLSAFKRFVSRRGLPSNLYSDNGTNFQGADRHLKQTFRNLSKNEEICNFISQDNIKWSFIPPAAPHFEGLREAGVKSIKHHLRRMIGTHTFTIEEMSTLLCQVEACVNSRPLGPLSNDANDLNYLTPGHFLIGRPLISVPEHTVLNLNESRLSRWQKVQCITEQFWKRLSVEYQHTLQQRYK
ncbi:uncharacterized protein LOC127282103 [Leptopilina boulardi]|uniref:uncharacterized protein LOC127282103 n=1 Tax=Leptopilina boulardi TaxID=63433 RepID=UPI0021F53D72|nr:uncharacterized protein LOC127282103 [Leptopilina boulardi]